VSPRPAAPRRPRAAAAPAPPPPPARRARPDASRRPSEATWEPLANVKHTEAYGKYARGRRGEAATPKKGLVLKRRGGAGSSGGKKAGKKARR